MEQRRSTVYPSVADKYDVKYMIALLNVHLREYGLDVEKCSIFEHSLLHLAGMDESHYPECGAYPDSYEPSASSEASKPSIQAIL